MQSTKLCQHMMDDHAPDFPAAAAADSGDALVRPPAAARASFSARAASRAFSLASTADGSIATTASR